MTFGAEMDEIRLIGGVVYSYQGTVEKEQKDFYVPFEYMSGGGIIRVLEISENYSVACMPSEKDVNYIVFPVNGKLNENKVRCHYFTRATKNDNNSGYGLNLYDEANELSFGSNALNLHVLGQLKFSQPFELELDITDDEVLGIIDLSGAPREDTVIATSVVWEPPETVIGLIDIDVEVVTVHRKGNRLVGVSNRKRDKSAPMQDISHIFPYNSNSNGRIRFAGFRSSTAYGLLCKFRRPAQFVNYTSMR